MMSIDEIISAYNRAKAAESSAKKEKERMAALILERANGAEFFETEAYRVFLDPRKREGLDTARLYKDFPDIKAEYGTVSNYSVITAKAKDAEKRTA